MALYLNFRSHAVGGAVIEPYLLRGDPTTDPPALATVDWPQVGALVAGRNVLFGVHGFNVNYGGGVRGLGRLDAYLGLGGSDVFVGVLWPGDAWLPVVDYPFEGDVAIDCGGRLAGFCARCDWVLKVAFQIGDPIADLLHDDHTPFQRALGYDGPKLPAPPPVRLPWQIPDDDGYGHGNYLPPSDVVEPLDQKKWQRVADFMKRAFRGQPQSWPP